MTIEKKTKQDGVTGEIGRTKKFQVTEDGELLKFLYASMADKSKTTVKSFLTHRQVFLNNRVTTQFDAPLKSGDVVTIGYERGYEEFRHPMLRIVFEDKYFIVIEKKYGLLSIATNKVTEKTAYHILSQYVKRSDSRNMIFILHRLDRETSGLMMFAKSPEIQEQMQLNWETAVVERKYYAVVEGEVREDNGTITSYLAENKAFKVYATTEENGKIAITNFVKLRSNAEYSLLELELETGRKNQIRAQLESVGHSIAGDKKYGAKTNPLGRVSLHAGKIGFIHPISGEQLVFTSPLPYKFENMFNCPVLK